MNLLDIARETTADDRKHVADLTEALDAAITAALMAGPTPTVRPHLTIVNGGKS